MLNSYVRTQSCVSLLSSRVRYGRPEREVIGGTLFLAGDALIVFMRLRGARRNR